jgi:hypothetical protein
MPVSNIYYLDGIDLESANSIFTNSDLSTIASDGWFSAGGVSRQLVNGQLLPLAKCVACPGDPGSVDCNIGYNVQSGIPEGNLADILFNLSVNGTSELSVNEVISGTEIVSQGSASMTFQVEYNGAVDPLDQITLSIESPGGTVISQSIIDSPESDVYSITTTIVFNGDTSVIAKITGQ